MDGISPSTNCNIWPVAIDQIENFECAEKQENFAESHAFTPYIENFFDWLFPQGITSKKSKTFSNESIAVLEQVISSNSSLVLPEGEGRDFFLDQIKILLSKPMSRELVLKVATGAKKIYLELSDSKNLCMREGEARSFSIKISKESFSYLFVEDESGGLKPIQSPRHITLAHELIHAYHMQENSFLGDLEPRDLNYTNLEEENTIIGVPGFVDFTENGIRKEFSLPLRYGHKAVGFPYDANQDPLSFDETGKGPLHWAAAVGSIDSVIALSKKGGSFLQVDFDGLTPLDFAIQNDHDAVVNYFLSLAKKNEIAVSTSQILIRACIAGSLSCVKAILQDARSPNCWGEDGLTPLQIAIIKEDHLLVDELLKQSANPNLKSVEGNTPIQIAAFFENFDAFRMILEGGANLINRKDKHPLSLYKQALQNTSQKIADALFEKGQILSNEDYRELASFGIANGLFEAMKNYPKLKLAYLALLDEEGHYKNLQIAIDYFEIRKANPNLSPVTYGVMRGDIDFISKLIRMGADLNAKEKNKENTALHVAALKDNHTLITYLIAQGALPYIKDRLGKTFAHILAIFGSLKTLELTLRPADLTLKDMWGRTPLHIAIAGKQDLSKIKLLCSDESMVMGDYLLNTPLHLAAEEGNYEAAVYLINRGANPLIENDLGNIPSQIARNYGNHELAKLLDDYSQIARNMRKLVYYKAS